jgi:hypothetical protein
MSAPATMSLPALADTDPIFEKIAKYRAAWESFRTNNEPVDANGKIHIESPEYKAWREAEDRLGELLADTEHELVRTVPRTQLGAVAMIAAYTDVRAGGPQIDDEPLFLLGSVLDYLDPHDALGRLDPS